MKELEKNEKVPQEIVINLGEKQSRFIGTITRKPNHIIFEVNIETGVIITAPIIQQQRTIMPYEKKGFCTPVKFRLELKQNCMYISALNIKNAIRKLENLSKTK